MYENKILQIEWSPLHFKEIFLKKGKSHKDNIVISNDIQITFRTPFFTYKKYKSIAYGMYSYITKIATEKNKQNKLYF